MFRYPYASSTESARVGDKVLSVRGLPSLEHRKYPVGSHRCYLKSTTSDKRGDVEISFIATFPCSSIVHIKSLVGDVSNE